MTSRSEPPPGTLISLCLGFSLVVVDTTMVTVGLPQMEEQLGIGAPLVPWIVDAYTVAFTALLLISGSLADRWGARRVYLNGTVLIALGSALCAVADSGWLLVAGRALQGVGAAGVMPSSLSLIESSYRDTHRQARAVVVWATTGSIASVAGLVLSGVLVSVFAWRSLFWANLVMAIVTFALSRSCLRETQRVPSRLKLLRQAMFLAALTAFVAGAIEWGVARTSANSVLSLMLMAAGVLLAVVFTALERRRPEPALQLDLLRHRGAGATAVAGFVINFGFYGQLFLFTGFLQRVEGMSPLQAGLVITVEAVGAVCGSPCGSWVARRYSDHTAMLTGLVVSAGALLAMAAGVLSDTPKLTVGASFFVGIGIDMVITPATARMLRVASTGRAGAASALLTMARQVGSVVGVAVLGTLGAAVTPSVTGFSRGLIIAALACLAAAYLVHDGRVRTGWKRPGHEAPGPRHALTYSGAPRERRDFALNGTREAA